MEIERINENTVKFFISYVDIEERGFDREEIWYNRERSEELFWDMMNEVHQEEEFAIEGPLWIQVQALEKGLEVLVTKAKLSDQGGKFEIPLPAMHKDMPVDQKIEDILDEHFSLNKGQTDEAVEDSLDYVISFKDFEDLISLSKRVNVDLLQSKLYSYDDKYYLYVGYDNDSFDDESENSLSVILEYGLESPLTKYSLGEYGKEVISDNVFPTIRQHFN